MNLLFFLPDEGACGWYRQRQPAACMARMPGVSVHYFLAEHYNRISDESTALLRQADAVVVQFAIYSTIPEPIRTAHLIAGALSNGESRGAP